MVAFSNTETGIFSNTGIRLSISVPLVQVTLVAGPPVDIQVRMESKDINIPDIAISPGHNGIAIPQFSVNRGKIVIYIPPVSYNPIYTVPLPEPLTAISQRYIPG